MDFQHGEGGPGALSWRAQDLMGRHPHDNVQLIT